MNEPTELAPQLDYIPKKRFEYILLAIIGGMFGLHHLYLGNKQKAITYFWIGVAGLCCCFIPGIVIWIMSLFDLFKADTILDSDGHPLV